MASFKTTSANGSYPYLKETFKGSSNGFKNTTRDAAKVPEDESHQIISSYFIGPRAENLPYFKENIDIILNNLKQARLDYRFDNDAVSLISNPPLVVTSLIKCRISSTRKRKNLQPSRDPRTSLEMQSIRPQRFLAEQAFLSGHLGTRRTCW